RIGGKVSYPTRVIMDSRARTPVSAKVIKQPEGQTIIAVTDDAPDANIRKLEQAGARIIRVDKAGKQASLPAVLQELGKMKLTSVLIEGGGEIAASALSAGVVDKVMAFIAPKIIGGQSAKTAVEGSGISVMADAITLKDVSVRKVECDLLVEGYPCSQDS
ncbi:MAG TPA: RibD family protein, partial [Armatimonadota bacterium]|nr:RibD family protein [Armatimonadota bacterium]